MFDLKSVVAGAFMSIGFAVIILWLLLEINAFIRNRRRFKWPRRAIIEKIRRHWLNNSNTFVIVDYAVSRKKFLLYTNWDDGYGKFNPALGSLNHGDLILVPKKWGGYFVTAVDEVDYNNNVFRSNFLGVMHNDKQGITQNIKRFGKPRHKFWKFNR